ncbi:MauE/DoxX family redox-associated membrane protein [Shivajiella indica]|uniref:MauE/DoxX family redox-associated membrane protein n=1 Tax=Shivajiella indica TaxID=872115 RepID=A0ABW5B8N4_9BACT
MKGISDIKQRVQNVKSSRQKNTWKVEVLSMLLAVLFVYTGASKLIDWYGTVNSINNQVFPEWMATLILYGLPALEIGVAIMLLVPPWRIWGLRLSVILMFIFTGYIGLVLTGIFGRIPCSCGGVLESLGWWEHLVFNVAVLGMGVVGLRDGRTERLRDAETKGLRD